MARKQFKITEEKIKRLIAESRGQGAAYQPWLQIGNFSSTGRGSRIRDYTGVIPCGRTDSIVDKKSYSRQQVPPDVLNPLSPHHLPRSP